MKKLIVLSLLLSAVYCPGIFSQDNLKALFLKCESYESVDVNVVEKRDKETKKVTSMIRSIKIHDNKKLVDEFLKAFKKDRSEAYSIVENKRGKIIVPTVYKFYKDGITTSVNCIIGDEANATITFIQKEGEESSFIYFPEFNFDCSLENFMGNIKFEELHFPEFDGEFKLQFSY